MAEISSSFQSAEPGDPWRRLCLNMATMPVNVPMDYQRRIIERRALRIARFIEKWIRNVAAFYVTMLLVSGIAAIVSYSNAGVTNLTSLSAHPATASPRPN